MDNSIIKIQNLSRHFDTLKAVDDLTLDIIQGEVFGLLGPNGAGKTTLIKMLTTLLPPTSGTATVCNHDIVKQSGNVRWCIGYVPQMLSADGTLTGYENLLIFAKLYDIPRSKREERIQQALALMGLMDAADKMVREYSGGMIRRLEIAQSTLHYPKLLFLDEPTIGLDPVARKTVWSHLDRIQGDYGTTIFLTTHMMEEADQICNRVAIMHMGKVVAIGTPDELKASLDIPNATLDDVFVHYAGSTLESGGNFREISRTRRTARRLG
jgi:ABC-2 type transport system ATP-binding protein